MRLYQVIQLPYILPVSGADLRNEAIRLGLQQIGPTSQISCDLISGDTVAKTVANIAAEKPDVVVVEGVALLDAARQLRKQLRSAVKIVIDFHNVESALLAEQDRARLPQALKGVAGLIFARRWQTARRVDQVACEIADAIWTCSRPDQAMTQKFMSGGPAAKIIPNPIPNWCNSTPAASRTGSIVDPEILFIGHLGYSPNKVAVRRLIRQIMPQIVGQRPLARLTIAGRSPNDRLKAYVKSCPQARLLPDPPDLAHIYRAADMLIVPISEGGGTRIKIIEALSVGRPIVATRKAVEGLEMVAGKHFIAAETPAEFATAVGALCTVPALRESLCQQGIEFVWSRHAPARIEQAVNDALATVG